MNNEQQKRIHPHKFTMWLAMGSIVMMFAGMTSAYVIKRNQANWQGFQLPIIFWYSTAAIILSSVLMMLCVKAFKQRQMAKYRQLLLAVLALGVVFCVLQIVGFNQLNSRGIIMIGRGSNVAASFLFAITALHILHVVGGIVAIAIMFIKGFVGKSRNYSSVPIEVMATYWHFVDFLWIYLFVFLSLIQ